MMLTPCMQGRCLLELLRAPERCAPRRARISESLTKWVSRIRPVFLCATILLAGASVSPTARSQSSDFPPVCRFEARAELSIGSVNPLKAAVFAGFERIRVYCRNRGLTATAVRVRAIETPAVLVPETVNPRATAAANIEFRYSLSPGRSAGRSALLDPSSELVVPLSEPDASNTQYAEFFLQWRAQPSPLVSAGRYSSRLSFVLAPVVRYE